MIELRERLDHLRELIQQKDFLEGKGLSNEVNIRIFCYDPSEEMTILHFINQLKEDSGIKCRLIEYNLYKVFLSICSDFMEDIVEMEEEESSVYILDKLHSTIDNKDFKDKIQYSPHKIGDVLLLTGVGEVFPFMRVHLLLEALQPAFPDIPIIVMYPGSFDGRQLKLFNRLQPSDYYRAFNVI